MKVLITGATGLIGEKIVKNLLSRGYIVHYLTTNKAKIVHTETTKGYYWNVEQQYIDPLCIEGVSVIIHLAGATIAKRWTQRYKAEILNSRVCSTQLLVQLLKEHTHEVRQVISASAIGVYPNSMDNFYTESFTDFDCRFLTQVVLKWEESVNQFAALSINVCKIRIGLVLASTGGMLPQLVKPVKLGLGAVLGTGKQWQSWIHIKDLARVFVFSIENNLQGSYNAVAPRPVTHRDMLFSIATLLHKPLFMPNVPKWIMRFIFGEMHVLLFDSQKVSSDKLQKQGFSFKYNTIDDALKHLL